MEGCRLTFHRMIGIVTLNAATAVVAVSVGRFRSSWIGMLICIVLL